MKAPNKPLGNSPNWPVGQTVSRPNVYEPNKILNCELWEIDYVTDQTADPKNLAWGLFCFIKKLICGEFCFSVLFCLLMYWYSKYLEFKHSVITTTQFVQKSKEQIVKSRSSVKSSLMFVWCCFYYFVTNSLVALLETLCALQVARHCYLYVYIYMSVCTYVCTYIYIYMNTYTHTYIYTHMNMYIYHKYNNIYTYIYMYMYMYISVYKFTYVNIWSTVSQQGEISSQRNQPGLGFFRQNIYLFVYLDVHPIRPTL